jgi:hypothetical protein
VEALRPHEGDCAWGQRDAPSLQAHALC